MATATLSPGGTSAAPIVTDIDDPKIEIVQAWHRDLATGQVLRVLTLVAPVRNWFRLSEEIRGRWAAHQTGRLVMAHRVIFV